MLQNWKNKFNAKCVTSAIDDIKVAITNVEVKATIIRSVKSSTLKKNDKYPTNIKRKVGAMVLDKWYSILRRKTTLALAWLILSTFDKRKLELKSIKRIFEMKKKNTTEVVNNATSWISYSTNSLLAKNSIPKNEEQNDF